jgi:hypothetical protein
MDLETPVTSHERLPDGVPLLADFNDDRNRLSYYQPILRRIDGVRTPATSFLSVNGSFETSVEIEYREVTEFMQELGLHEAFVRGDYSSGKLDGDTGSKIESQDPYDIEGVVLEMLRQLSRTKRHLGGRIAVREWIPHDREVRYFIRDGEIIYRDSLDEQTHQRLGMAFPDKMAERVSEGFRHFAWSVDFIRHEKTDEWYCIDMGLDGLYHTGKEWLSISEHLDPGESPQKCTDEMPGPRTFKPNW